MAAATKPIQLGGCHALGILDLSCAGRANMVARGAMTGFTAHAWFGGPDLGPRSIHRPSGVTLETTHYTFLPIHGFIYKAHCFSQALGLNVLLPGSDGHASERGIIGEVMFDIPAPIDPACESHSLLPGAEGPLNRRGNYTGAIEHLNPETLFIQGEAESVAKPSGEKAIGNKGVVQRVLGGRIKRTSVSGSGLLPELTRVTAAANLCSRVGWDRKAPRQSTG